MNPWALLIGVLLIIGSYFVGERVGSDRAAEKAAAVAVAQDLEHAQRQVAAGAAWLSKLEERSRELNDVRREQLAAAEQYRADLRTARANSAAITREVLSHVDTRPMDPVACALPADLVRLRNDQIRAANAAAGYAPAEGASRLRGRSQDPAAAAAGGA